MEYFYGTGAAGRGPGSCNVVASWQIACEYLSLGLHVGSHSRPTPLTIISLLLLLFRLLGWVAELGPGSYPDSLSFFFLLTAFFRQDHFWPPSNHIVL